MDNITLNTWEKIPKKYTSLLVLLESTNFIIMISTSHNKWDMEVVYSSVRANVGAIFLDENKNWNYIKIDEVMKKDFEEIRHQLQNYIARNTTITNEYKRKIQLKSELSKYTTGIVLNYNYSRGIKEYNSNFEIVNLHESVDKKNIILGHNQLNQFDFAYLNKETMTGVEDIEYKKKIRTYLVEVTQSQNKKFGFDLIILGHSMDVNDHQSILWLLNKKGSIVIHNLIIYYYNKDDLINKIYNLKILFNETDEDTYEHLEATGRIYKHHLNE